MKNFSVIIACCFLVLSAFGQTESDEMKMKEEQQNQPYNPEGTVLANFPGELTTSSPTYGRIFTNETSIACDANSLFSGIGTNVYYQVFPIATSLDGNYEFEVQKANPGDISDSVLSLYCEFDPLNADQMLEAYNDDGGIGLASLIAHPLTTGKQYNLVVATYSNGDVGTFNLQIRGPDGAIITESPKAIPTMGEWGLIILGISLAIFGIVAIRSKVFQPSIAK